VQGRALRRAAQMPAVSLAAGHGRDAVEPIAGGEGVISQKHIASVFCLAAALPCAAQVMTTLQPTIDAFVSAANPTQNCGGGGGITAGGVDSLNGNGQPGGRFDSAMRFDSAGLAGTFNAAFPDGWRISAATLTLMEQGSPTHPMFPRGPGTVAVSWIAGDQWSEGNGIPNAPTVGQGDELTWLVLESLRAAGSEPLGTFARTGQNVSVVCTLSLGPSFTAELESGALLTLQLTPDSPLVGFTCNSRNHGDAARRPTLTLTAVAALPEGDANCDGQVDFFDIDPFLLALFDLPAWQATHCGGDTDTADLDDSGGVDFFDIDPFLAALFG
jgi:hypothetical protein